MLKTNLFLLLFSFSLWMLPPFSEANLHAEASTTPIHCIGTLEKTIAISHHICETEGPVESVAAALPSDQEVKEMTGATGDNVTVTWDPNPNVGLPNQVDDCNTKMHTFKAILGCRNNPSIEENAGQVNFIFYPDISEQISLTDDACGPQLDIDCQKHNLKITHRLNGGAEIAGANPDYAGEASSEGEVEFMVALHPRVNPTELEGTTCASATLAGSYNCSNTPNCSMEGSISLVVLDDEDDDRSNDSNSSHDCDEEEEEEDNSTCVTYLFVVDNIVGDCLLDAGGYFYINISGLPDAPFSAPPFTNNESYDAESQIWRLQSPNSLPADPMNNGGSPYKLELTYCLDGPPCFEPCMTIPGNGTVCFDHCPFNEDKDCDGICSNIDCDDNDAEVGEQMFGPCDDCNPETYNDEYSENGCTCQGISPDECVLDKVSATIAQDENNCYTYDFCMTLNPNIDEADKLVIQFAGLPNATPESISSNNIELGTDSPEDFDGTWELDSASPLNLDDGNTYTFTVVYCFEGLVFLPFEFCLAAPGCEKICYETYCNVDEDGDGVCADKDCDDNDEDNENQKQRPGTRCLYLDAGDQLTIGMIAEDGCTCVSFDSCIDRGGDADGDGVCADEDCDDNDDTVPDEPGTLGCTYFDPRTGEIKFGKLGDDRCTCVPKDEVLCHDKGGDADDDGVCADEDCDDNNSAIPTTPETTCYVQGIAGEIGEDGCTCNIIIVIGNCEGQGGDADDDQVCAFEDCDDNNPNIPTRPGTRCIFFHPTTDTPTRGFIASDGCTCLPASSPCQGRGGDLDGDGSCADVDCDDNDEEIRPRPFGSSCNDNNPRTIRDRILRDGCTCRGIYPIIKINGGIRLDFSDLNPGSGGIKGVRPKQGIEDGQPNIQLYPNPAQHQLYVDWVGMSDMPVHMKVFNIYGQVMLEAETVVTTGDVLSLDVSTLANGTYHMVVDPVGETRITKTFIVID